MAFTFAWLRMLSFNDCKSAKLLIVETPLAAIILFCEAVSAKAEIADRRGESGAGGTSSISGHVLPRREKWGSPRVPEFTRHDVILRSAFCAEGPLHSFLH